VLQSTRICAESALTWAVHRSCAGLCVRQLGTWVRRFPHGELVCSDVLQADALRDIFSCSLFDFIPQVPDWASLRTVSWQPKTAMILCDIHDNKTHALVSVAPRSVLRKQIKAANDMGYPTIYAATELEYFQYECSYRDAHARHYQQKLLKPSGDYLEDYHILQSSGSI
jgi:hypothetical protein